MPAGRTASRQQTGQQAENVAAAHLIAAGMQLVERNYHCRYGEIDLIFRDTREAATPLVFVEVRYRRSAAFGGALESVNRTKQQKIHLAASHYLQNRSDNPAARFDLVTISGRLGEDSSAPQIDWLEDVDIQA